MQKQGKRSKPVFRRAAGNRGLRLHGTIARDLGIRIVSGRVAPGTILEGEIESSMRLGVSRSAYREAVRILAAKGLVLSRPKAGTRVTDSRQWHLLDPDVISWIFGADQPDERLLHALFELRTIIEPAAIALAATHRTATQLLAMRKALDRMAEATLAVEEGRAADREFHSVLLESSGNPFLASLTSGIVSAISWTTIHKQRTGLLVRDSMPDHERVYDAVVARDPQAARVAMANLIRLALLDSTGRNRKSAHPRRASRKP